jgi:hypothetical protein
MRKLFFIVAAAGLIIRLALAWMPVETLIVYTLPDDAFIYFVIARNIGSGLGATFDGFQSTNGFHPLWALLIAPIFRFVIDPDLAVHLALSFGAICDVAAGVLGAYSASRLTQNDSVAPLLTLSLYAFNPRALQESVNGLETGLAMLALAGCVAVWVGMTASPQNRGRAAAFGALAGLTFLARSDLAIIVAILFGVLLFKRRWEDAVLAGVVAVGVAAPWLVWSQLRVGTIIQSSGVAIPSLAAYRIATSTDSAQLWNTFLFPIINYSFRYSFIYPGVAMLAALIGLVFLRWPTYPRITSNRTISWLLVLPLIGALAIVFVHTFVRWYPRGWYFVPLAWACALVAGPILARALTVPIGQRYGRWVLALLGFVIVAQGIRMLGEPEYPAQTDMRAGADWLVANTSNDETIGAFNAGIYSYYSDRTILSLDGLVDWGAIEARQEKRLLDYFLARGGTLIIDHEAYAMGSFSPFFGAHTLEPINQLPVTDPQYGPIVIYRVQ